MYPDRPKLLGEPDARAARLQQIHEAHIAPLTSFVDDLRLRIGRGANIPYFDPWDGGVAAEVLFLLEAPGPKAVDFISRNNPDETAKNFFELNLSAGIPRKKAVIWNVVPWYIGTGKKIRPATRTDIETGLPSLYRLLEILPKLRVVVFVGRKAEKARPHVEHLRPELDLFICSHPSPMFVNRAPGNREKILSVLQKTAALLADTETKNAL